MKYAIVSFLESLSTPLALVSRAREVVYCNKAMREFFGVSASQIVGRRLVWTTQPLLHSHSALSGEQAAPPMATQPAVSDDADAALARAMRLLCPPPEAFAGTWIRRRLESENASGEVLAITFLPLRGRRSTRRDVAGDHAVLVHLEPLADEESAHANRPLTPFPLEREEVEEVRETLAAIREFQRRDTATFTLLGHSPQLEVLRRQQQLAARSTVSVVIVGESGTPVQRLAESIHWGRPEGEIGMLLTLDAATLQGDYLLEMVATFRQRYEVNRLRLHTLVLREGDAIARDVVPSLREHLAHFPPHLRLIVTSSRHPTVWPEAWGLGVATMALVIPPLRERAKDIPLLAQAALEEWNARSDRRQIAGIASDALDLLIAAPWEGNDAELARAVDEACSRAPATLLTAADLPERFRLPHAVAQTPPPPESARSIPTSTLDEYLARLEREAIERALRKARGNKAQAARELGISRTRLLHKIHALPKCRKTGKTKSQV